MNTKERENYIANFMFPHCQNASKYQRIAKIGHGTFGEVFKARDKVNNRFVAMKKVLTNDKQEGFPITALRELRILQLLNHENVIHLIEICGENTCFSNTSTESNTRLLPQNTTSQNVTSQKVPLRNITSQNYNLKRCHSPDRSSSDSNKRRESSKVGASSTITETQCQVGRPLTIYYLVLEFCEHDLAGLLSNVNVKFSLGEIKKVMEQLFKGLHYIHLNKILHRDLKAANILITKNGILKLADFGLARPYSNIVKDNRPKRYTSKVVTLWYRPPEILLEKRNYGPSVDMWGAGCIMAEMWTRVAILPGRTEQNQLVLISHLCGSITPEIWPEVESLDLFNKIELPKGLKRQVKDKLKPYVKDPHACDLLDKLLQLDPGQRIDSNMALYHQYFWTDPLPCDLSNMLAKHNRSMFSYLAPPKPSKPAGYMPRNHQKPGTSQSSAVSEGTEFYDRIY